MAQNTQEFLTLAMANDADISYIAAVCEDAGLIYGDIMPGAFSKLANRYMTHGLPGKYQFYVIQTATKEAVNQNYQMATEAPAAPGKQMAIRQRMATFLGIYIEMMINPGCCYIVGLYIHSDHRRQGYGKLLLDEVRSRHGGKRLVLLVHQEASWAIDFYLQNGFKLVASNLEEAIAYEPDMQGIYMGKTYLMAL